MLRVTIGAGADGTILVGSADVVATHASLFDCAETLQLCQLVGGAIYGALVVLFAEGDHLRGQAFDSQHRRVGRQGVAASRELFVLRRMALLAVEGGHLLRHHEAAVILLLLPFEPLMTVKAGNANSGVLARLKLMDHRRGFPEVAHSAFSLRAHELR